MTDFINRCQNDILRLILKECTSGPRDIKNYQLVCKRWNSIYDNRYWKELYMRDFQTTESLSDLANYKIVYQQKWLNEKDENRSFIPVSQLLPENMIFGPIQKMFNGTLNIVQQYYDNNLGVAKRPMWLKISGFKLQIEPLTQQGGYYSHTGKKVTVLGFDNAEFKLLMSNMTQYIIKNNSLIVGHQKGNIYTYNGRQYANAGNIAFGENLQTIVRGKPQNITIDDSSFIWNTKFFNISGDNGMTRIRENCERCGMWHNIDISRYGSYGDNTNRFCVHYTDKNFTAAPTYGGGSNKRTVNQNKKSVVFNDCTIVCTFNGFGLTTTSKLQTQMSVHEIWFSDPDCGYNVPAVPPVVPKPATKKAVAVQK